jgi:hypothetical protein
MKFLPLHCKLSTFVTVTVIFKVKSAVMKILFISILNLKILSCFATNLTHVCIHLFYSYRFDHFYMERQPYILHSVFTPT